jgi:steroid delta-isomerase-like uncharacterized protein
MTPTDRIKSRSGGRMTNQQNVDLMLRHLHFEETGQFDAVLDEMVDPPTYYIPARADEPRTTREAVTEIHHALVESIADLKIEVTAIDADDEVGYAEVTMTGVHIGEVDGIAGSNKAIRRRTCGIFHFADGKIVSETVYGERRELLRQVGLESRIVADRVAPVT